ncbi:ferredoxin [Patescibacteria group bacterium]|nr:ferredoxin [Patescibacteria group bacterium]
MIKVDKNKCVGCGMCSGMCPDVFIINADGKAEVLEQGNESCAKDASESCPVNAITL